MLVVCLCWLCVVVFGCVWLCGCVVVCGCLVVCGCVFMFDCVWLYLVVCLCLIMCCSMYVLVISVIKHNTIFGYFVKYLHYLYITTFQYNF